jgi:uncharacterized iron-regulated membrane protein
MTTKKAIGYAHLWLGLVSGLVVLILGITGCIYCFEKELRNVFYAERIFVEAEAVPLLPLDSLKVIAQAAIGNDKPISRVEAEPDGVHSFQFSASKSKPAWNYFDAVVYNATVYVNPYTGKVMGVEDGKYEFFNLMLALHYDLFLEDIGKQIVGWSCVMFVVLLITGIVLWWPKKNKSKQRLWFQWKRSTSWKRKNYDLHNIPGFYAMLLALCIALTGLWFAFDWFRQPVRWVISGGKIPPTEKPVLSDTLAPRNYSLEKIFRQSLTELPGARRYLLILPSAENKKATVRVIAYLNEDNYVRRSQLMFDQTNGKLLRDKRYTELTRAEKFTMMIYDIHVGKVLGIPGMILAFFASLIAATLPVTGFYIWYGRRNKKAVEAKPMVRPVPLQPLVRRVSMVSSSAVSMEAKQEV